MSWDRGLPAMVTMDQGTILALAVLAQCVGVHGLLIHPNGLGDGPSQAGGVQGGAGGEDFLRRPIQHVLDVVGDDVRRVGDAQDDAGEAGGLDLGGHVF